MLARIGIVDPELNMMGEVTQEVDTFNEYVALVEETEKTDDVVYSELLNDGEVIESGWV